MTQREEERILVAEMIAGDKGAFERFADGYLPALYRFALFRLDRDRELAREIVQATVCKAIAKLASFRGEAALMTWLCACCRTEIAAHFRKRRMGREVQLTASRAAAAEPSLQVTADEPEQALLRKEEGHLVHVALDLLPAHYGQALEWKYLEDLSVKEIAGRLQIGPKAAESLLTRARSSFREGYARLVAGARATADGVPSSDLRMAKR